MNEVIEIAAKRVDVRVPGEKLGVADTVTCGNTFAGVQWIQIVHGALVRKTQGAISSKIVTSAPGDRVLAEDVVARHVVSLRDATAGIARLKRQWRAASWSWYRGGNIPCTDDVCSWFSNRILSLATA